MKRFFREGEIFEYPDPLHDYFTPLMATDALERAWQASQNLPSFIKRLRKAQRGFKA